MNVLNKCKLSNTSENYLLYTSFNQFHPLIFQTQVLWDKSKHDVVNVWQADRKLARPTWSANMSTVFIVNFLEQKLKRSSKLGPSKSITNTLYSLSWPNHLLRKQCHIQWVIRASTIIKENVQFNNTLLFRLIIPLSGEMPSHKQNTTTLAAQLL